jgi:hypothetical protein
MKRGQRKTLWCGQRLRIFQLRINMKNYPILLKIKDFNDCECELSRVKYTESRKNISRKYTAPLSGDNRIKIEY